MAIFTVTNTNNSGAGSLRQAILDSNLAGGSNTIVFDSSIVGLTITLLSVLPTNTNAVIDADVNLLNQGTISGSVITDIGNDTITNNGSVDINIETGEGDDTVVNNFFITGGVSTGRAMIPSQMVIRQVGWLPLYSKVFLQAWAMIRLQITEISAGS